MDYSFNYFYGFHITSTRKAQLQGEKQILKSVGEQRETCGRGRSMHLAQHTRLSDIRHVDEDVVRRVTVQGSLQPLLVKVVSNETDRSSQNEQTVEGTDLDIIVRLLPRKRSRVPQKVDEAYCDTPIDV